MPLPYPIALVNGIATERIGHVSAEDTTSQRFEIKTDMNYWVNVDFAHPDRAKQLLLSGETIDTDDQATIDILMVQPEITHLGDTP